MNIDFNPEESNFEEQGDYTPRMTIPTDVYKVKIIQNYLLESSAGSMGLALLLQREDGSEYKETFYFSTRKDKEGKVSYYYNKNGKTFLLPGFTTLNDMLYILTKGATHPGNITIKEEEVLVYNYDAKADLYEKHSVIQELKGKTILVLIDEINKNKDVKTDAGYKPSNEEEVINEINKFLAPTKETQTELKNKVKPEWLDNYLGRSKGKIIDKYKKLDSPAVKSGSAPVNQNFDDDIPF